MKKNDDDAFLCSAVWISAFSLVLLYVLNFFL